jgi:hypothetical protein
MIQGYCYCLINVCHCVCNNTLFPGTLPFAQDEVLEEGQLIQSGRPNGVVIGPPLRSLPLSTLGLDLSRPPEEVADELLEELVPLPQPMPEMEEWWTPGVGCHGCGCGLPWVWVWVWVWIGFRV